MVTICINCSNLFNMTWISINCKMVNTRTVLSIYSLNIFIFLASLMRFYVIERHNVLVHSSVVLEKFQEWLDYKIFSSLNISEHRSILHLKLITVQQNENLPGQGYRPNLAGITALVKEAAERCIVTLEKLQRSTIQVG